MITKIEQENEEDKKPFYQAFPKSYKYWNVLKAVSFANHHKTRTKEQMKSFDFKFDLKANTPDPVHNYSHSSKTLRGFNMFPQKSKPSKDNSSSISVCRLINAKYYDSLRSQICSAGNAPQTNLRCKKANKFQFKNSNTSKHLAYKTDEFLELKKIKGQKPGTAITSGKSSLPKKNNKIITCDSPQIFNSSKIKWYDIPKSRIFNGYYAQNFTLSMKKNKNHLIISDLFVQKNQKQIHSSEKIILRQVNPTPNIFERHCVSPPADYHMLDKCSPDIIPSAKNSKERMEYDDDIEEAEMKKFLGLLAPNFTVSTKKQNEKRQIQLLSGLDNGIEKVIKRGTQLNYLASIRALLNNKSKRKQNNKHKKSNI